MAGSNDAVLHRWNVEELTRLVRYLRRHGVAVNEACALPEDGLALTFEPHLAQAQTLEGLLLAWPGIARVERTGPRHMHARGAERSPRVRRWRCRRGTTPAAGEARGQERR